MILFYFLIHVFQNLESDNTQTAISERPMTATATFLHQVKQSPPTINLLSNARQQIKVTSGTKNISIAKTPITVAPSINTGTTTIFLPVFNTVRIIVFIHNILNPKTLKCL